MVYLLEKAYLLKIPPISSIFIIFVSILTSIFSAVLTHKMINKTKLENYTEQTKKYKELKLSSLNT